MRVRHYMFFAAAGVVAFFAGFSVGEGRVEKQLVTGRKTIVDTVRYFAPMPESELLSGTYRYSLPMCCFSFFRRTGRDDCDGGPGCERREGVSPDGKGAESTGYVCQGTDEMAAGADSVVVELPVIQRHYAGSTYEAWVSGPVDPRLDSLRVFAPTTFVTKRKRGEKDCRRWHIGVTSGYGVGKSGFQPYIGVGVTYSIFSF